VYNCLKKTLYASVSVEML